MSEAPRTVLVVEDDAGVRTQVRWALDDYHVVEARDRTTAMNQLRRYTPCVVALDLGLPPDAGGASEGLATLQEMLSADPRIKVVVITGNEEHRNAVEAVGHGAYDFYQKPIDPDLLCIVVARAFKLYDLEAENRRLTTVQGHSPLSEIVHSSAVMEKVCRTVEKVAPSLATTCLLGESGTGKELVARALHRLSPRAEERFVALNCAAIPDTLLESELFGFEKGAFTGAGQRTAGKIEHAHRGTLFLDEIGDLPHQLQGKLLRFLQERTVERLGSRQEVPVDVRVVSATNQDLERLIQEGAFREDLYYRLCEVVVRIPPLRERARDVSVIAHHLLERFAAEQGRSIPALTPQAQRALAAHGWPGNVRELANRLKRALIMAEGSRIMAEDLELTPTEEDAHPLNLREVRERAEREALVDAIQRSGENLSRTAALLGITRPTLYALLDKHDLRGYARARRHEPE